MKFDKDGNVVEEEIHSGYEVRGGQTYQTFDGNYVNACWNVGDFRMNDHNRLEMVPDSWALEDLRQNEVIYRPVQNIDKIEINCYN